MDEDNVVSLRRPDDRAEDPLTEVLRHGARTLLAQAIEAEVATFLASHADLVDEAGRRRLVRNGFLPERTIQTGIGEVPVRQPRVRDRGPAAADARIRFTSAILPRYLRRTRSLEELLPWLYLKGISSGDFSEALAALLGPEAPGLSASTIGRLKEAWQADLEALAGARPDRQALRLLLGRRRLLQRPPRPGAPVHPGRDRCRRAGRQGAGRAHRRLPRERAVVARAAGRSASPRARGRPRARHRRRQPRLLEGAAPGLRRRPGAALLGPQDRQRAEQAAQGPAGQGQAAPARDLDGRDPRGRRGGVRPLRRRPTAPSTPRRWPAWSRTGRRCWPSTTSRPSTGSTSGPRTPSRAPSRRSVCGPPRPRAACHAGRR